MTFVNHLRGYALAFTTSAQKALSKLSAGDRLTIDVKLTLLVAGHQGLDIKKLVNYKHPTYRLRVGIYRIIYEVLEEKIVVVVVEIDHRKDVYK